MQKKLHIYLLLALAFWLLPLSAYTQTYPVTISTQLTQPSPIYLSNYANTASINSPIKVQLILNDLSIMNRQVRLKCYFQGAVSFVTNDFVVGASPIYLEGGFPTQLTNVELGPYFEYQNIKGVNPNQYAQPLPEGIYTISFEVYDFATNKKLSKKSSVTTVIFQNEPPFLNLPANQAGIVEQNIQNIVFSWTPRSINVSNVEYEFSLVEIWNTNTPLQNAFAYSPPLYTTTTRNTTVQYSIAEPQLIPGKTYAWRVKAKALLGAEEIGVFKNNGYSETYSFKYLTFCKPPMAITTTDVSQEQAKVTWSGAIDNFDYQVNYREKNADSKWYKLVTPREYVLISNLKPKTTYEYTVGAACDPSEYTHSNIQEFTTLAQEEIAFTGCGIKPDPLALSNKTPLPALFPNDVVTAGDFPIVVLKSTGSNGTFSGEGYVTLPFLEKFRQLIDAAAAMAGSDDNGDSKVNIGKYTRIRITFNNIGVNTDFKLISGEIVASYDPKWGSMVDGDKLENDLLGDNGKVIPIDIQFEIKSVVKNADGSLTITGTNDVVVTQPKTDNDVIITDRNGKQYAVSPSAPVGTIESTGKVAPGGIPTPQNTNGMGSGGNIKEISSPDVSITFADGTGFYSLDENPNQDPKLKANTKLNSTYDVISKKDGTNYYVHNKAISDTPKAEDYVTAKATFSNGKTTADIVFKTENGTEVPSTWSGNVATLTLKRTLDFAKESILATVKPPVQKDSVKVTAKYDIAGTLNMWHATGKKVNITLVGLNGGETPTQSQAQDYLNSIYGKAGIQFEVSTTKTTITDSWGASIETGDSDLLNTYTNGQQTITNDFQTQLGSSYKNDTYYVFFTKVPASKPGILGFMPLKRQFGFIFSQSEDKKLRTLAHELGHGVFGLQHPFTNYNTTVTTDLLMDYGTGTALNHNDWEIMHAPGLQLYQFTQGSSDGENRINDGIDLLGNIISKVDIDENKTNTVLVGTLSKNAPYLRVGYNEYSKADEKLLHKYKGEIKDNKVVYIEESTQKEMPYAITLIEKGSPIIGELGGGCTYNKSIISDWTKPTNYTTEQVISEIRAKIEKQKPKWESISLYKNDPSCAMTNTLFTLIENDKENTCPPNIIATDVKKLNDLFSKTSYTDDEVVNLLVNQKVCLEALRQISWERLSKAFKQLGASENIKEAKETALLRLMAAIKAEKYKDFIVLLEGNENLLTRNLLAKVNNKSINPFDGNNFTSLMKGFIFVFNQVVKPKIASGTSFDAINIVQNSYLFPDNKENLFNVQFKNDQLNINQGVWNIETDCHWVAETGGDGREECITTKQEIIWNSPIIVSPFQPISLAKESDFSLISGVSSSDIKIPVLPAIALYYAYNEGEIKNINEYVKNSLDVVTLMVPVSKIATSTGWFSKSWAFLDKWNKVNAGINLSINNSPLKNVPELSNVLETYNNVTAILNITTLAGGISKATVSKFLQASEKRAAKQALLQAAKDGDKEAQMILDVQKELKVYGDKKFGSNWWQTISSGEAITYSLKKIMGKSSSENIIWKNLDDKNLIWADAKSNVLSTPKTFANETGTSLYDIVLENGYYVKFDINDGRILLGNTNGNYNAFAIINKSELDVFTSSTRTASEEVFNTKLKELLISNTEKLKVLSGVVTKQLSIGGKTITLSGDKVNTLLGRFRPDVANLFNELGSFKNVGLGETKGGINILNKPDFYYNADNWWTAYNKPWLDKAINRGDDIYLATIPQKADDIIKDGKLSGAYAQELDHLATSDYKPKNITQDVWNNIKTWLKTSDDYIKSVASAKAKELKLTLSKIEPAITDDLVNLAKNNGGRMEGLDFRLKTLESLERKLISDGLNEPMNDVLRYTVIIDDDLAKGTNAIMKGLESKGYKTIKIKNTFQEGQIYKGINTNVKSADGNVFEIQYHTTESFNIKQNINHSLYEEYRLLDKSSTQAIKLEEQMIKNSDVIKLPQNINSIKSY